MTHDPLHNVEGLSGALYDGTIPCRLCEFAARVRADERRWVTDSAGKELLNHKIRDGVCACGMDAPDALKHLAWIVSDYVRHSLRPEHEVALP